MLQSSWITLLVLLRGKWNPLWSHAGLLISLGQSKPKPWLHPWLELCRLNRLLHTWLCNTHLCVKIVHYAFYCTRQLLCGEQAKLGVKISRWFSYLNSQSGRSAFMSLNLFLWLWIRGLKPDFLATADTKYCTELGVHLINMEYDIWLHGMRKVVCKTRYLHN